MAKKFFGKVHENFAVELAFYKRFLCALTEKDKSDYHVSSFQRLPKVAVIKSFNEGEEIKNVRLLGFGDVEFVHKFGVLTVKLPENAPTEYTNCLAVELV